MMSEVEKPFICPEQDCNMKFTSEDHLQVHKGHHEMQLTLSNHGTLQSTTIMKHSGFLADQMQTPSRFLKNYEEVSLFQDINLNPFDLEFRKASQNKSYKTQLSIAENHCITGSLETPRILPPVDSDETISSTSRDDSHLSVSTITSPESTSVSSVFTTASNTATSISISTNNTARIVESVSDCERKEGRKKLTLNVSSSSPSEGSQNSNIISTPTPVITAGPSVSQSLGLSFSTPTLNTPNILTANIPQITLNGVDVPLSDLNTPGLSPTLRLTATPPVIKASYEEDGDAIREKDSFDAISTATCASSSLPSTPTFSSNSSFPSSPSATVLQLLLKLPDGQAIPVEIPATPVVSTAVTTNHSTTVVTKIAPAYQTTAFTSVITNPTPSLAKMKLKQVLSSNNTAAKPGVTKHSRATTADRIAEMTKSRNLSGSSGNGADIIEENSSSSNNSNFGSQSNNNKTPRRRRNSNSDENPEEKRRKFLERNRVAAVRCREKKKRLVESMVAKSDEMKILNHKLQCEVSSLRSEVASLKALLLRHKDCPVTLAMQGNKGCESSDVKIEDKCPSSSWVGVTPLPQSIIAQEKVLSNSNVVSPSSDITEEDSICVSETSPLHSTIKIRKRSHSLSSISFCRTKMPSTSLLNTNCDEQPVFSVVDLPKSTVGYGSPANNVSNSSIIETKPFISVPSHDPNHLKPKVFYIAPLKPNKDASTTPREIPNPGVDSKLPCVKDFPEGFSTSIIIQNYSPTGKNPQHLIRNASYIVQNCESVSSKESENLCPSNSRIKFSEMTTSGNAVSIQPKFSGQKSCQNLANSCITFVPNHR